MFQLTSAPLEGYPSLKPFKIALHLLNVDYMMSKLSSRQGLCAACGKITNNAQLGCLFGLLLFPSVYFRRPFSVCFQASNLGGFFLSCYPIRSI